jgi:hypothetical protein
VLIIRSWNTVLVRFTEERWGRFVDQHLKMNGQREQVLETLAKPDMVQDDDFGKLTTDRPYARDDSSREGRGPKLVLTP